MFKDEVLELRDEYNKEVTLTQPGPLSLSSNWFANKKSVKILESLGTSLSSGKHRQTFNLLHLIAQAYL